MKKCKITLRYHGFQKKYAPEVYHLSALQCSEQERKPGTLTLGTNKEEHIEAAVGCHICPSAIQ